MSYKLFVDDMRPIPDGWIGARTVSEAIAVLQALHVTHLSLDHDIVFPKQGVDNYQALSHETFKGVAYYVATMALEARPHVRIHTANAGAAKTLCQILGLDFSTTYQFYTPESY